ncbi:MAG: hypothetical protein LQ348_006442 [Seirophora lacunosa]|nr:MAG: hypothetical protein LQ348_006442 [Seirophora lacunosa]
MYDKQYGSIAPTQERFEEKKQHYRELRDKFRADPRAASELAAWKKQDNNYDYQLLNENHRAFIPPGLIGKTFSPSFPRWVLTDTFFSEYANHNAPDLILSETRRSYIIGNVASYDGRQYPSAVSGKRPEGQSFAHSLVIPKDRVYNVVDPAATADNCDLIREMRTHFISFWNSPYSVGKAKMLARAKRALEDQDKKLRAADGGSPPAYEAVRDDVFAFFEATKPAFEQLKTSDFVCGFHVFPDNSIGHLHMHVFPHADAFRVHSTREYDWKTVPVEAIVEVEHEDQE